MKKLNVVFVFNKDMDKTLFCLRTKEPYKGKYNMLGGKIESDDYLNEAYRELEEESGITKDDINIKHLMDMTYYTRGFLLQIYYGILNKDVEVVDEVNKLEWLSVNENFFDLNRFAGDGNIGHIYLEILNDLGIDINK